MSRNYVLEVADKNLDLAWSVIMSALDSMKEKDKEYWRESHDMASEYFRSEWFRYRNRLSDRVNAHYFLIEEFQRTVMEFASFVDKTFSLATTPFVDMKIIYKMRVNLSFIYQTIMLEFKVTADKSISL